MFIELKLDWEMTDAAFATKASDGKPHTVPAGRYEVERIPNPFGFKPPFLVLKGTKIGAAEGSLRDWPGFISVED